MRGLGSCLLALSQLLLLLQCLPSAEAGAQKRRRRTLIQIWREHRGQLADKWESYLHVYARNFGEYRKQPLTRLLELGVLNGGSLQVWSEYFGPGRAEVVGVDITPEVCERLGPGALGKDISLECIDATDATEMAAFTRGEAPFDIIIDDASHRSVDVIRSFALLFPHLAPGGLYAIEDIGESYENHTPGPVSISRAQTAVAFFSQMVDYVNIFHITQQNELKAKLTREEVQLCRWVESVQFHDGVIVVRKRREARSEPMLRVMVGDEHVLTPEAMFLEAKQLGYFANSQGLRDEPSRAAGGAGRGTCTGPTCREDALDSLLLDADQDSEADDADKSPPPHRVYINEKAHYHDAHLFFHFHSLETEPRSRLQQRARAFCKRHWLFFQSPGCDRLLTEMAVKELGGEGTAATEAAAAMSQDDEDEDDDEDEEDYDDDDDDDDDDGDDEEGDDDDGKE